MRLALLTTETTHHTYYAHRLAEAGLLAGSIVETKALTPPFETAHPFEQRRDEYERETLIGDGPGRLEDVGPVHVVESVNDAAVIGALEALEPDLVVAFGTGLIGRPLIERFEGRLLNLHGGDPERYRGLDTHLWAVYHRDRAGLVTALHHVAPRLDTGAIVGEAPIELPPGSAIHELRARNTEVCVQLTLGAAQAAAAGRLGGRPQNELGRYYSFMPAVLKDVCVRHYEQLAAEAA